MLKYLPKEALAQWAIGAVALAGAATVAYVVSFPADPVPPEAAPPDLPRPDLMLVEPPESAAPPAAPVPEVQIAMAPPASDLAPQFDLVRVSELGDVLIAGKAPAASAVTVLIDEAQVAQTVSTPTGEFVLMFEVEPAPVPRVLELEVRLPSGDRVRSQDTLMLAPSSAMLASVEVAPLLPAPDAPPQPATAQDTAMSEAPAQAALPEAAPAPTLAPMALLVRPDGSAQMLGDAARVPARGTVGQVRIDTITYDDEGEVSISGRSAQGEADLQIYLDNQPILRARAAADGNWQAQLAGIDRGVYQLRVDELDAAAQVTSRAEIPFERVTPEIAREATGPQALIVQPGNTLWAMSRDQFGDGRRYMRIFDANRDQIRNPDLIFPGQVFVIPDSVE